MKICLFADASSIHIRQLSYHLARRGHHVHVVTHKPAELEWASVEKFAVPPPNLANFRGWNARRSKYMHGFFRSFDIVNVQFLTDWVLSDVARDDDGNAARLIATAWGSDIIDPPGETSASSELAATRRNLLQIANAVTTCGPTFASTVAKFAQLPPDAIHVVPFGVDLDMYNPNRFVMRDKIPRIGFFKGFRAVYGATTLVRAMPAVLNEFPQARFDMIGDGAQLAECQALTRLLKVDQAVEWLGRMEHAQLPERIATWQLSVVSSVHEAFGVAALESQAMAVPVVASAVDGLHDTVRDGETGVLFPPGDHAALANAIIRLLHDDQLRAEMAQAGRSWVARKYCWQNVVEQWIELFARVREHAGAIV